MKPQTWQSLRDLLILWALTGLILWLEQRGILGE